MSDPVSRFPGPPQKSLAQERAGSLPPTLCNLRHAAKAAFSGHSRALAIPTPRPAPPASLPAAACPEPCRGVSAQVKLEAGSRKEPNGQPADKPGYYSQKEHARMQSKACDLKQATPSFITLLSKVGIQQVVPGLPPEANRNAQPAQGAPPQHGYPDPGSHSRPPDPQETESPRALAPRCCALEAASRPPAGEGCSRPPRRPSRPPARQPASPRRGRRAQPPEPSCGCGGAGPGRRAATCTISPSALSVAPAREKRPVRPVV